MGLGVTSLGLLLLCHPDGLFDSHSSLHFFMSTGREDWIKSVGLYCVLL